MSQLTRTLVYLAAGLMGLVIAWLAQPASIERDTVKDDSGQRFFPQFDPLEARSLEIVGVDEATSQRRAFKVAQQNGKWTIPSKQGYPADAQDQLAKAASSVMDVVRGAVVSERAADHELYGVVDPSGLDAPPAGAGTRVTLADASGKTLVDLIIGKNVNGSDGLDGTSRRYIRVPNRDRVYACNVDTSALTTTFENWIERDLLKMGATQIKDLIVNDYSIDEAQGAIIMGDVLTLHYDSIGGGLWNMDGLAPNETLDSNRLSDLRNALYDLQIIDVRRKPVGLAAALAGDSSAKLNLEDQLSLQSAGYYIVQNQLRSNEGETIIRTTDGLQYALHFGEIVNVAGDVNVQDSAGTPPAADQNGRFVFITVEPSPDSIDAPIYDAVPDLPTSQPAATSPDGTPATAPAADPVYEAAVRQRDAVIASNTEKEVAHAKKVADINDKVKDLNRRFADWYFVVSDEVYQKIRLTRADVVKSAATQPAATQPENDVPPASPPRPPEDGAESPQRFDG